MFTETTKNRIRGVLFDAVGTLIEPDPGVTDVYTEAARRHGVALDRALVKARFHQFFRNDEIDEARGPMATDEDLESRRWRRIVAQVLPEVPDPGRVFEELWEHFGRPEVWRCFDDVAPALTACRAAGLPVRIASNFDARLRAVVAGLPTLAALGETVVISSEVGHRKPHPSFYQAACASLGLEPGQVLCVGDDPENDVRGAQRAGLNGLLLDRHRLRPEGLPRIDDLAALAALWAD